jgi:hypothetical protein
LAEEGTKLFTGTWGDGIYYSTDSGGIWNFANNGMPLGSNVTSIVKIGTDMFAGTDNGYNGGVFRSIDSGTTWNLASIGLIKNSDITCLSTIGTNLFAGVYSNYEGVIYRSKDSGNSWVTANDGLPGVQLNCLAVRDSMIFAGTHGDGIFFSTNDGADWIAANSGLTDSTIWAILATNTDVFVATDSGVWRRPLSDFGISEVSPIASTENSLTTYPNPFSQSTTISFTSPESGIADVSVVNILGVTVAHIFSGELDAGAHSFTWDANGMAPEMYECIVRMNGMVQTVPIIYSR